MWIVIAQFICMAATIGLLAIVFDLDAQTPAWVRYPIVALAIAFFSVFAITVNNPQLYEHAAAIAFTGVAALVAIVVLYMVLTKQIQPSVLKIAGGALCVSVLLWVVGSCSDINRQKNQIKEAKISAPTAQTVTPGDTTRSAIEVFEKLITPDH